ncbi:MAG: terminase family protein [Betaproteobacteria bacterium]|nr:terminase family protein [Betaproteobacteria bacterium]
MGMSRAEIVAALPPDDRAAILAGITDAEMDDLAYDWAFWGRPEQQLPTADDWDKWLILAGRGWGKTRTGAETVRAWVRAGYRRIALVAATAADARDVLVEGESGILRVHPDAERPLYEPSKRRLTWPNGAIATTYSADEPDRLRGPQHDAALCDELASWSYPEAWDMLMMGLRLGDRPLVAITTTPRPIKIIRDLMADPRCRVTRGATHDNAINLAPQFLSQIVARYEGTRLGRQELYAEVLTDNPGALWHRDSMIEPYRVSDLPYVRRIVVAIDPAVTSNEASDETGIIVAALGEDGRGYILEDQTCKESPAGWAARAIEAYHRWGADRIVAEGNQGGDMIETIIRSIDPAISYTRVHARHGKYARAEPVAALYEQGRVSHVGASLGLLEDELCEYDQTTARASPNRLDALVWALTSLMLSAPGLSYA